MWVGDADGGNPCGVYKSRNLAFSGADGLEPWLVYWSLYFWGWPTVRLQMCLHAKKNSEFVNMIKIYMRLLPERKIYLRYDQNLHETIS